VTREIGEIFKYKDVKLRVEKDIGINCERCHFRHDGCTVQKEIRGECSKVRTNDNIPRVFVEVKE
jgi:hypothetical protein